MVMESRPYWLRIKENPFPTNPKRTGYREKGCRSTPTKLKHRKQQAKEPEPDLPFQQKPHLQE